MPKKSERVLGGHAVLAVGSDDAAKRFTVRNSWGIRYSQAFCVNSLSTGKLGLTFPIRFDLQLNSIFKEINARSL